MKLPAISLSLILSFVAAVSLSAGELDGLHSDDAAVLRVLAANAGYGLTPVSRLPSASGPRAALQQGGIDPANVSQITWSAGPGKEHAVLTVLVDREGRILSLSGNGPWLPNESVSELAKLPELRVVQLDHNVILAPEERMRFSGETWNQLEGSKLYDLKVGHGLDDTGAAAVAQISGLQRVFLVHSQVTDAGLRHFAGHPGITDFEVSKVNKSEVGKAALPALAGIPGLKALRIAGSYLPYADGLEHLEPLAGQLEVLDFRGSLIPPSDRTRLEAAHPNAAITTSRYDEIQSQRARNAFGKIAPEALAELKAESNPSEP